MQDNGTAYGPTALAPRLVTPRVRTAAVTLAGEYGGVTVTVRVNLSTRQLAALSAPLASAAELAVHVAVLVPLVLAWNLADDDGTPLPITEDTLRDLPHDLLAAILEAWGAERQRPLAATSTPAPPSPAASG